MSYWWVNQGESYRQERNAGILWAPKRTTNGQTRAHWDAMDRVVPGDRILHFADQHVMAVSAATVRSVDGRRPDDLPTDLWDPDGRLLRCEYADAVSPVFREQIPEDWRRVEPRDGPFQVNLGVKTGYLWPLSDDFGQSFLERFGEQFSFLSPAAGLAPPELFETATNVLRDLLGSSITTVNGQANKVLAVEPGRVLVGTTRSPEGQWVPIEDLQRAMDTLQKDGQLVVEAQDFGYRSAFIRAVLLTLPGVTVSGSPPVISFAPSTDEDDTAPFAGPLSVPTTVDGRGEQAQLRRRLLGNADEAECALCGRKLPTRFLVAAHVKKRNVCTEEERRDLSHIAMPACLFGCDALFENGYVAVDDSGRIVVTTEALGDALNTVVRDLVGRRCTAFSEASQPYFAWHLTNTFRA